MQPTRAMFNELAGVMTNSHLVWGHPEEAPPGPVPDMWITMVGDAGGNADFADYVGEPDNSAPDIASTAIYPGVVAKVFWDGSGTSMADGEPNTKLCHWNTDLLRWEFMGSESFAARAATPASKPKRK